jgi:hypothetical protein
LDHALLELGTPKGPLDTLRKREWIMLAPYCADAGSPRDITAAFSGKRRLRVTNVRGEVVASAPIRGRRIPIPADALENGVGCESTGILKVPLDMPGGVYFIDDQWAFAVSRPQAPCTVVLPLSTMQAFNDWGGRSTYTERQRQREAGRKVALHYCSLRRPLARRFAIDVLAGFLDWLPRGALADEDIRFIPDYDLALPGALAGTRLLLIPGRSEYWTRESRSAVDAYVDQGGDMMLLSSETMLHEVWHEADRMAWRWWGSPEDANSPGSPYWHDSARRYPLIPSIGPNPGHGGTHRADAPKHPEWGGYHVGDARSPVAHACGLVPGEAIPMRSTVYYDGLPVRWYEGDVPMLDERALPFHRWTLLAHSFGRHTPLRRIGAWFAFQRAPGSGRVVHFGSFAWSVAEGIGGKGPAGSRPAQILDATIRLMRSGADLFGPQPGPIPVPLRVRLKSLFRRNPQ